MYEEFRKKIEPEFGPQVHNWSDLEITRIMTIRNSDAYKTTVANQAERQRDARMAENATRARIKAKLQEGATEAAEELSARRESMLGAWIGNGGTEEEFEAAWPSIRGDILKDRALRREDERERSARLAAREAF